MIIVLSLTSCASRSQVVVTKNLKVVTTLFPQYDFVRQIAGDKVDVSLLLPPGVESHAYEPSPRDIVDVQKAAVFIYTGKNMEPWAEKIIQASQGKLLIIDSSKGIELMDEDDDHEEPDGDDENEHGHDGEDPHIWLNPIYAQKMVDNIVAGLAQADAKNAELYRSNGDVYKQKLQVLDDKFLETFAQAKTKQIIYAGHFAFGHFATRYGLEHISPYTGFAPDAEPTPQRIAELIENVRDSIRKVIYYEELVDPKVAKVIAEQTGAKMLLLHAAHNVSKEDLSSGITYLEIMEGNLQKLQEGFSGK
ncbi:MAG: zinc ABC transporter substrate-binding protein [Peptococcaceae bacterium]|nr:zinc ABC transporter substrate-binding protein [Peptococcaceae bacterium]